MSHLLLLGVVAAALLLFFLFIVVRGWRTGSGSFAFADVRSFEALMDPKNTAYLQRSGIAKGEYRRLERLRLRAAILYLVEAIRGSGEAVRYGVIAQQSADLTVAAIGRELCESAISFRLKAVLCIAQLCLRYVHPSGAFAVPEVLATYRRMADARGLIESTRPESAYSLPA